ncbi:MAG: prephenate dehydratase domain-containing protein, partial [Chthoniobacterales bacterium]
MKKAEFRLQAREISGLHSNVMPRKNIAYLGPEGTFSHILALRRFGKNCDLVPCQTLEAIFDHVLLDPQNQAIVPVENSSGGTIYDTVDLLIQHAESIHIQEELALDVRPALLGHKKAPVRRIYSHFVQLQHCREWLKKNYPDAEVHRAPSTAVAAQQAASRRDAAAISARGAALLYKLDILKF